MPAVIEPILPVRGGRAFDDPNWIFDVKYDGFRAMACFDLVNGGVEFYSKKGHRFQEFQKFGRKILAELQKLHGTKLREVIFDGELVVFDPETGLPDFERMIHRQDSMCYVAFDLLWKNRATFLDRPLQERKRELAKIVPVFPFLPDEIPIIGAAHSVARYGIPLFEAVEQVGLEGIVAKRRQDFYLPTTAWIKILNPAYDSGRRHRYFRRKS